MAGNCRLKFLMSPGRIGTLALRNRIIMASMGTNLAEPTGHVGERSIRFYEERAKGGVGLIVIGVASVAFPAGACNMNQVAISDDKFIPDLKKLTDRIHAHGAKCAIQLQHAGKVARMDIAHGRPMWVPSEFQYDTGDLLKNLTSDEMAAVTSSIMKEGAGISFQVMTDEDISAAIKYFSDAAQRAIQAGFDGIEIHGAHGYLISSFISPKTNLRTDEYGGSVENRSRLLTDVIKATRKRVGDDFPIWCRIDGKEIDVEGGISIEDAKQTAVYAEKAGADAVHISAYGNPAKSAAFTKAPLVHEPCGFVDFAAAIKKCVNIPVITVGRIEPEQGDAAIKDGRADFVAMARKLIAEPNLPLKIMENSLDDIRPCIACYTCVGEIFQNKSLQCASNPIAGRESEFATDSAATKKRVLVIGGGPGGMEAARTAALCGHSVTLCDKGNKLGGTLFFASILEKDNGKLMDWLIRQIKKLPVDVRLETGITPEFVQSLNPDIVLIASGARRQSPDIPGVKSDHVFNGDDLRSLMTGDGNKDVAKKLSLMQQTMLKLGNLAGITNYRALIRILTKYYMPLGKKVAIVGGGLVGVEIAEFLAERGREVSIIEENKIPAAEMAVPRRWRILDKLHSAKINLLLNTKIEKIHKKHITFTTNGQTRQTLPIDSVIIAKGIKNNMALSESLRDLSCEMHVLGDCKEVCYIKGAMEDATRIKTLL